jgi:hypothetical protein
VYYICNLYYNFTCMRANVQARLDRETQDALDALVRRLDWSPSRVVRESLRLMAACYGTPSQTKVIGVGRFASGRLDLGSNKKHLKGFGR